MTPAIYPCLWFDGKAHEAAEYYCSIFNNSTITGFNPIVTTFSINGFRLMALNGGPRFTINPSISLFVYSPTIEETNRLWNKLIEGGKVMMAMDKYPWSERYGWLQDKYGMTWQISVAANEGKQTITPSMLFTGNQFGRAEEAINFYTSVFANSATTRLSHYEEDDPNAGKVLYSEFTINSYPLIAMDGPGSHAFVFNEAISLVVGCDTQAEIDRYWNKLTEGGKESMCGWLVDRFGVSWQVVPSMMGELMSDPDRMERVGQAIMNMKKLDIETLKNA